MNITRSIDDHLQTIAGGKDAERSIDEFKHFSGTGNSRGWRFNRDEIHERS